MGRTGVLSAIPYLAAVLLMLLVSYISDKTQRRVALVWPFLLVSGIAMLGSFVFAERNFTLAFICLVVSGGCMYAPYGPFYAIIPDRLPRNVTAEVMALINSCGALGSFTGVYFVGFLRSVTGNSRAGFLLMSFVLVCSALILFWLPASTSPELTREMSQT
jgi:nitrate/nitrite transporter NarK